MKKKFFEKKSEFKCDRILKYYIWRVKSLVVHLKLQALRWRIWL